MTDLDITGLADLYEILHRLSPSSRKREYWRGRVDEFVAQNAVTDSEITEARAQALARIDVGAANSQEPSS